jgi:hypothetical protein
MPPLPQKKFRTQPVGPVRFMVAAPHPIGDLSQGQRDRACQAQVMTLAAIWRSGDDARRFDLWAASDSRISDSYGKLIDEGIKIFELPVRCAKPNAEGSFSDVFYSSSFGLVCAGSTLIFQHVYATLVPLLNNLGALNETAVSIRDAADLAAWVCETLVSSLGQRKGPDALRVEMALIGWCPLEQQVDGYSLLPRTAGGTFEGVEPVHLDLSNGNVTFLGDQLTKSRHLMAEVQHAGQPDSPVGVAPLTVIREMIEDDSVPTIGGDVQALGDRRPGARRLGRKHHPSQWAEPIPANERWALRDGNSGSRRSGNRYVAPRQLKGPSARTPLPADLTGRATRRQRPHGRLRLLPPSAPQR